MKTPKYYLKPRYMVTDLNCIPPEDYDKTRLLNHKPHMGSRVSGAQGRWFRVSDAVEPSTEPFQAWNVTEKMLTHRYFIEEGIKKLF